MINIVGAKTVIEIWYQKDGNVEYAIVVRVILEGDLKYEKPDAIKQKKMSVNGKHFRLNYVY